MNDHDDKGINKEIPSNYTISGEDGISFTFPVNVPISEKYIKAPKPYYYEQDDILINKINKLNETEIIVINQILFAYAFDLYLLVIISCRSLLESIIDRISIKYNESKQLVTEKIDCRNTKLSKKINKLRGEGFLKDEDDVISRLIKFYGDKTNHELYNEYGQEFDRVKSTLLLSSVLAFIKNN